MVYIVIRVLSRFEFRFMYLFEPKSQPKIGLSANYFGVIGFISKALRNRGTIGGKTGKT